MKTLKQLLIEAVTNASADEYYNALHAAYKTKFKNEEDVDTFIDFLKMNDEDSATNFGIDFNIEKEDNGTLIVAYGENDQYVMLFGIVSAMNKMNRNDIPAINIWIDRLIEKMKEGKTFITSPHELSLRLIKHVEEKVAKEPKYTLTRKNLNTVDLSQLGFDLKDKRYSRYANISLSMKKK